MRTIRASRCGTVPAVLAVALVSAGCATEPTTPATTSAAPGPSAAVPLRHSSVGDEQLPDPCSIPREVLRGAGLNPDAARPNDQPGWRICSWNSADDQPFMTAELYVTKVSYPELLANSHYDRFVPTRVGGREATYFRKVGDVAGECYLAWGTTTGTVWAGITAFRTGTDRSDPCQHVPGWADAAYSVISS